MTWITQPKLCDFSNLWSIRNVAGKIGEFRRFIRHALGIHQLSIAGTRLGHSGMALDTRQTTNELWTVSVTSAAS